jgi:hypothetical protein
MSFHNANGYTMNGSNAITFDVSGGTATLVANLGNHVISAPMVVADNATFSITAGSVGLNGEFTLAAGKTLTKTGAGALSIAGVQNYGVGATFNTAGGTTNFDSHAGGNLSLSATNNGNVVNLNTSQDLNNISISNNAVVRLTPVPAPSAPPHTAGNKHLSVKSLNIDGASKLDLGNGALIVDWTGGSNKYEEVLAQVISGLNNYLWDGPGIDSSIAAADALETGMSGLGVADNSEMGIDSIVGASFSNDGLGNVPLNSVLVKYTYYGDADLNGKITLDDFNQWSFGFENQLSGWVNGDFDYSGNITLDDFNTWNFGFEMLQLNDSDVDLAMPPPGGIPVPEPTPFLLFALSSLSIIWKARQPKNRRL